ncbi:WYL domain-containing protein [Chloracidobacterium validum]|uniref:WYL domain-containing protein n=1 Tax=Chloracidobacterium validum TaxID=2821543 RepID=A0ABX8BAS9_9BACT|nr:WYL domain-containing protein [Chloracidobacterium validum]QUW04044.1 WYL domain-containing protein [Chloracidobacterium validum]
MLVGIPLLLAQRPHSLSELARHFNVKPITINRAVDQLGDFYPITEEKHGRNKVFLFRDGYTFKPPKLTVEEIATLLLSQKVIGALEGTAFRMPFARHGESLLKKVRATLPEELRAMLDSFSEIYGTSLVAVKDYSAHAQTIETLAYAAYRRLKVALVYRSLTDGQPKARVFAPYAVYFDPDGGTLKTLGVDSRRSGIIPLSIDHIEQIELTDETFDRPADFSLKQHLDANCFNGIHGAPVTVRLRAFGVTARIFTERTFHPTQRVIERFPKTAHQDESVTIELTVAGGRGLERFVLSWLPEIEVLAPDSLREAIRAVCARVR